MAKNDEKNNSKTRRAAIEFFAPVVAGQGRGKGLGFPTINFDATRAPKEIPFGIYRCEVFFNTRGFLRDARGASQKSRGASRDRGAAGALHYGPILMFGQKKPTCEVHLFEFEPHFSDAKSAKIRVFEKIREVQKFDSEEDLKKAISSDIDRIKSMLE